MDFENYFFIWNKLTSSQQLLINNNIVKRHVQKGTVIQDGNVDCTGLVLVQSGQLRAYILSNEGREISIYRLFERDLCLFSASCMIKSISFNVIIEVEKDSDIWIIPTKVYKQLMEESVVVANYTNEVMASRFSEVMWLIEQVMWKSFDKRLASFLLEESLIENSKELKITHDAIGKHLGNPREVVTRMLRYFQNEGLVTLSRGTIKIVDLKKLEALDN